MCFGCSLGPSHRDGSFEYQQQLFWLRNLWKIILIKCTTIQGLIEKCLVGLNSSHYLRYIHSHIINCELFSFHMCFRSSADNL